MQNFKLREGISGCQIISRLSAAFPKKRYEPHHFELWSLQKKKKGKSEEDKPKDDAEQVAQLAKSLKEKTKGKACRKARQCIEGIRELVRCIALKVLKHCAL